MCAAVVTPTRAAPSRMQASHCARTLAPGAARLRMRSVRRLGTGSYVIPGFYSQASI